MKTIVFFCIPAHGHTNPTLSVVRELVRRGHQVIYYSYNMLRDKIEDAGAVFVSCDGYDRQMKLTPREAARLGSDLPLSAKVLVDTTLALDDVVCRDMERLQPDCIVGDSMAVWGKAVALKLGIPFVSSTTTFAFNRHSAKVMPQSPGDLLRMLISMPRANRQVKRLKERGYPVRHILDIISNDPKTHTIVYTSSDFQPCSDTFPAEYYSFVGPSIREPSTEMEKTKEHLVYISMGTVNNDMIPLYKACIRAFADLPYQVVLSVGKLVDMDAFGKLPGNVSVYPQVDQIAVLEKADVFLTHCGMNSVSEALYYGVPLVMLPKTPEQKGVAARVFQLGAGIYLEEETQEAIFRAVESLLGDGHCREQAEAIGAGFRKSGGAAEAADKILSLCR